MLDISTLDPVGVIHELIARLGLSDDAHKALAGAIATRGKCKGYLLKRAPAYGTPEYSAWNAATLVCNPYAASVGGALLSSLFSKHAAIFDEVKAQLDAASVNVQRRFSYDRTRLEALGVY
jgi:hypothetical protein